MDIALLWFLPTILLSRLFLAPKSKPAGLEGESLNREGLIERLLILLSLPTARLVVVVVAFGVAVIGFILSFIPHLVVMLIASIIHFIAFLLALIAFILQIVLYVYTRNRIHKVTSDASIIPGPGFYLTLISIPLLFFSALTVCCGYRKVKRGDSYSSSSKPSRFGRRSNNGANTSTEMGDYDYSTGGDKIPMQSSRQRVLDAFRSDK